MKANYAMIVDLTGKHCVVIGGGRVAERKIKALLNASASVTAVSLGFTQTLQEWGEKGLLRALLREYNAEVLDDAFLVIAATDDARVNQQVYLDGSRKNVLMNITDCPDLSSFIVPAVVQRGKLLISVSTSGASPSAAMVIRNEIGQQYGAEYEPFMEFLSDFRMKVKEFVDDARKREEIHQEMMQLDILSKIRSGTFNLFKIQVMEMLQQDQVNFTLRSFIKDV